MRENSMVIENTSKKSQSRVMIGIPMTGLVRSEWMMARYGQVIPCNWSQVDAIQWIDQFSPLHFLVADARNIVVHHCVEKDFQWLVFIDSDVVLPHDFVLKVNERMLDGDVPMWSGIYFTKSRPSEPLIYRGRGTGYYRDWKFGDQVWVDGIPMGCTAIHSSILKALYEESEAYEVKRGFWVRRVFETPARTWYDPEELTWYTATGTEDLTLCSRIIDDGIFKKAGWPEYADKEFPFLIDTSIYCLHIDPNGVKYPSAGEDQRFKEDGEERETQEGL